MIKKIFRCIYNCIRFIGYPCYRNLLAVTASTTIEKSPKANMKIGKGFRTRRHVEINVRGHAQLSIEENVFLNSGCILTAREKISIGNHTIFGPNVLVYDHDHQIENEKVLENTFVTEAVCIGNNVWIGAGTVILRGSVIEDNCIIAAGSIVKGHIPAGSIYVQKREKTVLSL